MKKMMMFLDLLLSIAMFVELFSAASYLCGTDGDCSYQLNPSTCLFAWEDGNAKGWWAAELHCRTFGAHLASVMDVTERDAYDRAFFSCFENKEAAWIGINDVLSEGVWGWTDGNDVTLEHWNGGTPSGNDDSNNCGYAYFPNAGVADWFLGYCSTAQSYVCKHTNTSDESYLNVQYDLAARTASCNFQTLACPDEYSTCGGKHYSLDDACNYGTCIAYNDCECGMNDLSSSCTANICFNKTEGDPAVCNYHGNCTSLDMCDCDDGWDDATDCLTETSDDVDWEAIIGITVGSTIGVIVLVAIVIGCLITLVVILNCKKRLPDDISKEDLLEIKLTKMKRAKKSEGKFEIDESLCTIKTGDLELVENIGSGGSGAQLFKAKWKGKDAAVKVFKTTYFSGEHVDLGEFLREADIMAKCRHPNLIAFYGVCHKSPRLSLVMEYCEFSDLEKYLKKSKQSKLPYPKKLEIMLQIAEGVEYLHDRGLIHRDLKPGNVLLTRELVPKLIDFGLARLDAESADDKMTRNVGTSYYMAPEVIMGEKYDKMVDVYSFAIMMFEVLFENFTPYRRGSTRYGPVEYKVASSKGKFRPVLPRKSKYLCKEWYTQLMKQCWDHNPKRRPPFSIIIKVFKKNINDKDVK